MAGIAPTYNTIVRPPEGHLTDGQRVVLLSLSLSTTGRVPLVTDRRHEYHRTNTVAAAAVAVTCRLTDHPMVRASRS